MITIRRGSDRGHFDHGWLDTWHTFSFGEYHDPSHMQFQTLRVMNEDRVQAGRGFGMHAHKDMEIITYVLEGALEHRDSLGNGSVIRAGDLQRMSAGTGIRHSEFNASATEPVHLYQIWILPERTGLTPGYEELPGTGNPPQNRLRLVASPDGRDGSLTVHQDVRVHLALLDDGRAVTHPIEAGRRVWLQVLRGAGTAGGEPLSAGDGAAARDVPEVTFEASAAAEIMLFDLA